MFATGSRTGSNDFCVEALNKAIHKFVPPEITTMDQAGQLISFGWTDRLRQSGMRISMDGKGVRKLTLDNIFIERPWRTLIYECIHLHARDTGSQTKAAIRKWMTVCNHQRPHSANPISRCNEQLKLRQIPSRRRDVAQSASLAEDQIRVLQTRYSMIDRTRLGCSGARNRGAAVCTNRATIGREDLEERVLGGLHDRLMHPELFAAFVEAGLLAGRQQGRRVTPQRS